MQFNTEAAESPYETIRELFSYSNLPGLRDILWGWLKVTVSGIHHEQTVIQRSDLVFLYEKMEELVEAAHVINEQQRKPGKTRK